MAFTAKVENYLTAQRKTIHAIAVDSGAKACVNCIWYEKHYQENRGNISYMLIASTGYCLRRSQQCGALRKPCADFENRNQALNKEGGGHEPKIENRQT